MPRSPYDAGGPMSEVMRRHVMKETRPMPSADPNTPLTVEPSDAELDAMTDAVMDLALITPKPMDFDWDEVACRAALRPLVTAILTRVQPAPPVGVQEAAKEICKLIPNGAEMQRAVEGCIARAVQQKEQECERLRELVAAIDEAEDAQEVWEVAQAEGIDRTGYDKWNAALAHARATAERVESARRALAPTPEETET